MEAQEKPREYLTIRLDADLKKFIAELAKREHRSLAGQIVTLIDEALKARAKDV